MMHDQTKLTMDRSLFIIREKKLSDLSIGIVNVF